MDQVPLQEGANTLDVVETKPDADGYIGLPEGVGLGVDVDEKALEEAAKKPQTYKWPGAKLKDGSVSDY